MTGSTPYMMATEALALPFSTAQLSYKGVDIDSHGAWLAIVETRPGLQLTSATSEVALPPEVPRAMVRWLGDKALVVGARVRNVGEINAWIIDPETGAIVTSFSVGDGVEDVVVLKDFIVVSYFDEGVFGKHPLSNEGISVFDHAGRFQWGYNAGVPDSVWIADCYAICRTGGNTVGFCPYLDFPFIELDVGKRRQTCIETRQETHGAGAITSLPHAIFFHGPYPADGEFSKARPDVYVQDRLRGELAYVGQILGHSVRGLSHGRMLSITDEDVLLTRFHGQVG